MVETVYFAAGAVAMTLATAAFAVATLRDPDNRTYHSLVTAVAGIAAVCYAVMAAGVGIFQVGGTDVYLARYVQWVLGTPLIVLYLGMLADIGAGRLGAAVALDVAAMLAAAAAAFTTGPVRIGAFVVGTVLYTALLALLLAGMESAGRDRPSPVRALFRKLRNLTAVTWSFYPVVWLAGPLGFGLLDPVAEILLVTYLDLIAKGLFGFIALNSRIAVERMPEVDSLQAWRDVVA